MSKKHNDAAMNPWQEPVDRIFEVSDAVDEFFVQLAAMSMDFERMARTGLLPMKELAQQVAYVNLSYLVKAGQLSPAVLRHFDKLKAQAIAKKPDTNQSYDKKNTVFEGLFEPELLDYRIVLEV